EQLRYPIGKFSPKDSYSAQEIQENIKRIEVLPSKVESLIKNFSRAKLDTPYRDGGWTARQVLHHLSDSHMNAYIRFKWTLTENTPIIKAYDEKLWAETPEIKLDPVISLDLLKALHIKWTAMLKLLGADELKKEFIHPETKKHIRLDRLIALYAWHGDHHLGHLEIVAKK
ncbi:MAG TPA: putative metal-dependent hydrolase, partial [Cyclobacteriaceae bacterium]|nr:putative metal-dependent hydrolase [Cyclobacteriaceae bacterium]